MIGPQQRELRAWLDAWAARPELVSDVRLERVARDEWTPALLRSLYALAITMSAEDYENFERHALTNDCVHLFRLTSTDARPSPARTVNNPDYRENGCYLSSMFSFHAPVCHQRLRQ